MRLNRRYEQGEEFKARQGDLFDAAVLFGLAVAVRVRAELVTFARRFMKSFGFPRSAIAAPVQLNLWRLQT